MLKPKVAGQIMRRNEKIRSVSIAMRDNAKLIRELEMRLLEAKIYGPRG